MPTYFRMVMFCAKGLTSVLSRDPPRARCFAVLYCLVLRHSYPSSWAALYLFQFVSQSLPTQTAH